MPPDSGHISDPEDYQIDEATGHPFRVQFNPARRFSLGLGAAASPLSDAPYTPTLEASIGLSFRSIFKFGEGAGLVLWQVDHRFVSGWFWPLQRKVENVPALDGVVYAISAHRHDEAPSAVLPTTPPISIPFPFDIGFESEIGRFYVPGVLPESAAGDGRLPYMRIGVMRASFFLDPWRSEKPGRSLEIGVGARYDVEPIGRTPVAAGTGAGAGTANGSLSDRAILHRIAPMTATSLRFRFQSQNGLTVLDMRGDFIPHWTSEQTWKIMGLASGRLERTLFAINDQPFALQLAGDYRYTPQSELLASFHELRVSLGLAFNAQIP